MTACFILDGTGYRPTALAKGPWGMTMGGHIVGGLLGRCIEAAVDDPHLQPARLTVDLLSPVPMEPVEVRTVVVRSGRRIHLVDASMTLRDKVVARASALYLRRGNQPDHGAYSTPIAMPPMPDDGAPLPEDLPMLVWTYGPDLDRPSRGLAGWQHDGPKFAWVHIHKQLVEGEDLTPFARAAIVGDITSSLTHFGTTGLPYINADYTLTLSRLPVGPLLGVAALTHYSDHGVATGSSAIVDAHGPIGSGVAVALANPGFTPHEAL